MLTDRQRARIAAAFNVDKEHVVVEVTWLFYQGIVAVCRDEDGNRGKRMLQKTVESLRRGVPTGLDELRKLGRSLRRRAADILAYFDLPGTSSIPTEAICESGLGWSGTGWSGWMSVVST
jgi:hypothetical protein